jgi:ferric-dicitrate binding protein FerR (iron transport regulator)
MSTDERRRDESTENLIRQAGPRPMAPPDVRAAVYAAVHQRWQRRKRVVRRRLYSAAAVALLAATAAIVLSLLWPAAPPVARVERLQAFGLPAAPSAAVTESPALVAGRPVLRGEQLVAPVAAVAVLRRSAGGEVRLAPGSELWWSGEHRLRLVRGALYIDSPPGTPPLQVDTPWGSAVELGTRFEVRSADDGLVVRVRSGRVAVEAEGERRLAGPGQQIRRAAGGALELASAAVAGDSWAWVVRSAAPFALDGATLGAFLDWVSAETGRPVRFAEPALVGLRDETLHGSLGDIPPDRAPNVVLPALGLAAEVRGGELVVEETP